ncbi:MAG: helix-turn-helix transcriptional regulator [Clostridia bacterium]|nr:helix-turn-helix transcriptional regulator [Clostridia bacterium]
MTKRQLNHGIIGQNIRRLRLERGWTQRDLSAKAALSAGQISKIERGIGDMSVATFFKLCRALACCAADILDGAE